MKERCSERGYAPLPYGLATQHLQAGHPEMKATSKSQVFPQIQALGFNSSTSAEWTGGRFQDAEMNHNGGTHQAIRSSLPCSPGTVRRASAWLNQRQGLKSQLMLPDQGNIFTTPV